MRKDDYLFLLLSLALTACASAPPPLPPVAVTSHAVSAADYPADSVRAREQGTARIRYLVLEDGSSSSIELARTSGFPRLDTAAIAMIKSWRFKPAFQEGRPVIWGPMFANVVFVLRPKPAGDAQMQQR
jgi:TonB family protein